MRVLTAILLAAAFAFLAPAGSDEGRRGNALYEEEAYAESAAAYRAGLAALGDDAPASLRAGLLNNLGAALLRMEDVAGAREHFAQALIAADTDADRARAAYNLGNAAYLAQDLQAALQAYKSALLATPDFPDARYNYEVVARQLQNDPTQQDSPQDTPPPSDYAKALKAQAEALVAQQRYQDAYDLMMEGLQVDPTVRAFQTFITRTKAVADIDQTTPQP